MQIGDLDKYIELQKKTQVSDGMGGFTDTYSTEANVWASIWPISSKERVQADQRTGEITHRIRIYYRRIVRADWRIKYGNRYFAIAGPPINIGERNEFLEFLCMEVRV